jgi:muramoyltetrapeptide carboxypeptidase LdcA involved in peptidoglycan recycling
LRERGFDVQVGQCLDGESHVSAPAQARADELMQMLLDPGIRAVVPPWGGETGIDLLPLLDFDAVRDANPTWLVGLSDTSTLMTPLTLLSGLATLHGTNLMDTPYRIPDQLMSWLEVATAPTGSTFRQSSPRVHRLNARDDWVADPSVVEYRYNGTGGWRRLDDGAGAVDVRGRLIGGCLETVANLAGAPYGDTSRLRGPELDALLVYVEVDAAEAFEVCRSLHGMRLRGFFDGAAAVLVGRTGAPDSATLTQDEAVLDALGVLGVPVVADVECGHPPPRMQIVNGAVGRLVLDGADQYLEQTLA